MCSEPTRSHRPNRRAGRLASAALALAFAGACAPRRDDGPPPDSEALSESLPEFDRETDAHVREVAAAGRARGNRADVVAKIGDSITESQSFLQDCGMGWYDLGA